MIMIIQKAGLKFAPMFTDPKIALELDDKMIDEKDQQNSKDPEIVISKQNLIRKRDCSVQDVYMVNKKLGEGSFGTVLLVTHKQLKIKRALKIINKQTGSSSNPIDELELLKKLDHQNIIKLLEYYESKNKWYIVTEYFEGGELFDEIVELGKFTQKTAALIFYEILKALVYIHAHGIAHRDIKAENIMVKKLENNSYSVKVIDWGLGVLTNGESLSRRCGTPEYCAPQVLNGHYSIQCDMWSIGVLLYIMLSGCMPFKGKNLNQTVELVRKGETKFDLSLWNHISLQAKELINNLLVKNPAKRLKASQCLDHIWIKKHLKQVNNQVNLDDTLKRLKNFNLQSRFQVVVLNYILNFIEGPKQYQTLKKEFEYLDINKDGSISYDELLIAYRRTYGLEADLIVADIFKNIDLDGSGAITFSQFITFASQIAQNFNMQQLKQAFKIFDKDSDGMIDKKQISQLLSYEKGSTNSSLDSILNEIDINNDGKIDLQQFVQHVNKAVSKLNTNSNSIHSLQQLQVNQQSINESTIIITSNKSASSNSSSEYKSPQK